MVSTMLIYGGFILTICRGRRAYLLLILPSISKVTSAQIAQKKKTDRRTTELAKRRSPQRIV